MNPMQTSLIALLAVMLWIVPVTASSLHNVEHGIALFHTQQYDAAKMLFEQTLGTTDQDATAHYYLCRIHFALSRYDKAIEHCKTAVQLHGNAPEYYFWLGRSYGAEAAAADPIQQATLAPKIRKSFEKTIELDPTHVQGRMGLVNFYLRAPAIVGGSLDKAHGHVQILIQLNDLEGRLLLARFYEKTKQLDTAEAEYQALHTQYRHTDAQHEVYKQYGYFLLRQKRLADAIQTFTEHATLFPTRATAYEHLGDGYSAGKCWQEAVDAYRQAIQLDPSSKTATQKLHAAEKAMTRVLGRK